MADAAFLSALEGLRGLLDELDVTADIMQSLQAHIAQVRVLSMLSVRACVRACVRVCVCARVCVPLCM